MKNWLKTLGLLGVTGSVGFAMAELTPELPTATPAAPQETSVSASAPAPVEAPTATTPDQELLTAPVPTEPASTFAENTEVRKAEPVVKRATGTGKEVKEYKEVLDPIAEGPAESTTTTNSPSSFFGGGVGVAAPSFPALSPNEDI